MRIIVRKIRPSIRLLCAGFGGFLLTGATVYFQAYGAAGAAPLALAGGVLFALGVLGGLEEAPDPAAEERFRELADPRVRSRLTISVAERPSRRPSRSIGCPPRSPGCRVRVSDLPVRTTEPELPPPHLRHYVKLEPGASVPPDLPPGAQRYRLVDDNDVRSRAPIAAGIVVAMVTAGVALASIGAWGGFVAAPFVAALAAAGWAYRAPAFRYVPSDMGDYVVASRSMVAESLGALAAPERLSTFGRVLCGTLGVAFLALIVVTILQGALAAEDATGIALNLVAAALGVGLSAMAVKGEIPFSSTPGIPSSPWFASLADPTQPLPDDAPIARPREVAEIERDTA